MQQDDLRVVAQLFEKAGDEDVDDQGAWQERFKDFVKQAMATYASRLKIGKRTDVQEKVETWRARFELFGIVVERLHVRLTSLHIDVAEVVQELMESQAKIFNEVLTEFAAAVCIPTSGQQAGNNGSIALLGDTNSSDSTGARGAALSAANRSCRSGLDSSRSLAKDCSTSSPRLGREDVDSPSMSSTSRFTSGTPQDVTLRAPLSPRSYSAIHIKQRQARNGFDEGSSSSSFGTRPSRELTLAQLRDIILAVYASKAQYDAKCLEMKEPTETMEQHLYAFLGKRYGLDSATQEWATTIFRGIQKFAPRENDVAVFGKILQNTLAESFPAVQDTLTQSANDLLRQALEDRQRHRPQTEIEALWRARSRCGVPLDECGEVLSFMYNERDADEIMDRLGQLSRLSMTNGGSEQLSPDSLRLKDFMQILLNFQTHLTEGFLTDFVEIFRQVNTDGTGFITGAQLEDLVSRVSYVTAVEEGRLSGRALFDAKAEAMTSIQRFKKGATFSQCVDLFKGLISARWNAVYQETA